MTEPLQDDLLKMRQQNIGRLFQRAARAYSELALIKMQDLGYEGLTLFHTALISNLDADGTRISVLAERAGISKQAMGQLVNELAQRGYIERQPDPADKRATVIMFTETGYQFLRDAYQVKLDIEAEYTAQLGEDSFQELHGLLKQLLEGNV